MVEINFKSRYELLKKAFTQGYAQSRGHGSAKGQEITVAQNGNNGNNTTITCQSDGNLITTYNSNTGEIKSDAYTSFFEHLNHNIVYSVLKNAMAIEMAHKDGLLEGPKPIRSFEKEMSTKKNGTWTDVDEPIKVKHKMGSDKKPLITLPIRRSVVERSGLNINSWVIYSIKIVKPPEKVTRRGGEGIKRPSKR